MILTHGPVLYDQNGKDVTQLWPAYLFEFVILQDVTLKDIMSLLAMYPETLDALFGTSTMLLVDETLNNEYTPIEDIEYIELSLNIQIEADNTANVPNLDVSLIYNDGVVASVSFLPLYRMSELPIKLGPLTVDSFDFKTQYVKTDSITAQLGSIINSLIWEFSYYGTPEERDETYKDVVERYKAAYDDIIRNSTENQKEVLTM